MQKTLLYSLVIASCALRASAQIGGLVNQVENTQTRNELNQAAQKQAGEGETVPQLYEGESSDVGPQSVVQARPRRTLFAAEADVQFFYTDNMFLAQNQKRASPRLHRALPQHPGCRHRIRSSGHQEPAPKKR